MERGKTMPSLFYGGLRQAFAPDGFVPVRFLFTSDNPDLLTSGTGAASSTKAQAFQKVTAYQNKRGSP